MTYTYAILEVSPAAFVEIRDKLKAAGYENALHEDETILDMRGIALQQEARPMTLVERLDIAIANLDRVTTALEMLVRTLPR